MLTQNNTIDTYTNNNNTNNNDALIIPNHAMNTPMLFLSPNNNYHIDEITLGQYLFERLRQAGVKTIFGLPGDFNLVLLDNVYKVPGLQWCGNTNELNASYATDGYSRINPNKLGCLCTTFGVGELSAINGIAGSFSEHVGILHIVGTPSVSTRLKKLLVHHTLGNGDFDVFHKMAADISEYSVLLTDADIAAKEIDKCIRIAYIKQKPVYLGFPANLSSVTIPRSLLDIPLDMSLNTNNPAVENEIAKQSFDLICKTKNRIILADGCCIRHDVIKELNEIANITQFPIFVTPMGKSSLDEQNNPNFGGVYVGTMSSPDVKEFVENADLILSIGTILSDFSTGNFQYSYKTKNVIEFHSDYVKIKNAIFPDITMKYALQTLIQKLKNSKPVSINNAKIPIPQPIKTKSNLLSTSILRQEWVWEKLSHWFKAGDIIISETGTSAFGVLQTRFPKNCTSISQVLWGSVGYSMGSCLGASFARKDFFGGDAEAGSGRVIVFVGDGALQMTVQEISAIIKWGLKPYLFVMNNHGYTIDRILHSKNKHSKYRHETPNIAKIPPTYNDIQPWNIQKILPTFGAAEGEYENWKVELIGEFNEMLENPDFGIPNKLRLIEVLLPVMDGPVNLLRHVNTKNTAINNNS
ncbi:related to Pyruvate decarboxylase [Saccharomycodes ludwigii]|uniref:Related to Pyruvate decarboxylase n=1 Tax=Saccharomycodes ludwigii TaxID=36035 RepID=A0A376BBU0_9ASCO|nr:related to Pyruvate decarboxylase [Saccharomycodes ludwigii]